MNAAKKGRGLGGWGTLVRRLALAAPLVLGLVLGLMPVQAAAATAQAACGPTTQVGQVDPVTLLASSGPIVGERPSTASAMPASPASPVSPTAGCVLPYDPELAHLALVALWVGVVAVAWLGIALWRDVRRHEAAIAQEEERAREREHLHLFGQGKLKGGS